jgi:hypothetical protein
MAGLGLPGMGVATSVTFKRMAEPHIGHSFLDMVLELSNHVSTGTQA